MHRRWLFLSAAVVLIVASLTVVFLSGHKADAGRVSAAPTPATGAEVTPSSASPAPSARATEASPRASAKRAAGKKSPSASAPSATVHPAKPSAAPVARPASGTAPLAGRIRPGVTHQGVATFYQTDGTGACLYDASGDVLTGAMNTADYEGSKACGAYVVVRAASGASVTVRITNECPGDCAVGQIDLSAQAFAKLAAPSAGRVPITWELASPGDVGTLSVRYKTGSTRYWCGIQVIGHRNPLARLEVRSGSGWRQLARADYNYFLAEDGGGCGGPIRITDIYGERLTVDGMAIRPNVVQPTRVQFARH
ncbi:expansin EXLX1 family cellulose-binding protein [Streptomyces sp. NPDC006668]|uniref:expansin EXLX1 family cellulose-binding protein n=1 Tax=Streptomyces sp. NPDC006668 TaxID=3156903 RepID=UPI0033C280FE